MLAKLLKWFTLPKVAVLGVAAVLMGGLSFAATRNLMVAFGIGVPITLFALLGLANTDVMAKLKSTFRDPRVAIPTATAAGAGVVGGGTWFATRNLMIAVSVALAIALIALVVILLRTLRSEEREQRLVGGLEPARPGPGANQAPGASDMSGPNGIGIRSLFNQAVTDIRQSRLGPGGLEALPWWLTLGPTGEGKTELIRNGGLDVPAEFAHGLRSGPTQLCNFILTNQAVIVDTSGSFVDAGEDAPEDWQALLRLLKKHRPNGPLEGILIAQSAVSLLTLDGIRLTEIARSIRRRLNEVSEALGFDVPVYFIVTQTDRVQGFPELIASLPADRTREAFGWTNDRRDVADVADVASSSIAPILDQLDQILPELLMRETDPVRRRNLFLFPNELKKLSAQVAVLLRDAFAPSAYGEVPFLRGIYFTSAMRGGTMLSSAANDLGYAALASSAQPPMNSGGIFTSGLFRDILIGDDELAIETAGLGHRTRRVLVGLAAAISLTVLGFTAASFVGNYAVIQDLDKANGRLLDAPSSLDAADALREQIVASRSDEVAFDMPFMGRPRAQSADQATESFTWAVEREHIRPTKERIKGILRRADHDAFEALAVLALDVSWLGSRAGGDPGYRPNIVQYTPFDGSEHDRNAFSESYDAYVRWLPEPRVRQIIKDERNAVLESATSLLDLRRLEEWSRSQADRQPPVRYADFGIDATDPQSAPTVLGAYTRAGWEGLVRDLVRAVEDSGGAADDNIRRFRTGYVTRFDRSWRDFMLGTPTIPEASTAVFESPHLSIFERLTREVETDLPRDGSPPAWMTLAVEIRGAGQGMGGEGSKGAVSARDLGGAIGGALLGDDAGGDGEGDDNQPPPETPWSRYKEALDQVSLDASVAGAQTGERALQVALSMPDASAFSNALALIDELIPPRGDTIETRKLRRLLSMPVLDAASAVLDAAEPELSRRWHDEIYRPFAIERRDPISLYNPNGGALAVFMQEELEPFFDRDEPRAIVGDLSLPMSPTFLAWLDHAREFQRTLFPAAGAALEVPVRLEGIPSRVLGRPDTFVTRRDLRLDCASSVQTFEYREGSSTETLLWRPDCQQVTLRVWIRAPGEPARELMPRKEWNGPLALPQFLREGAQVSQGRYQWTLKYDDTEVRIEYRLRSGDALLGFEHLAPPSGLRGSTDAG